VVTASSAPTSQAADPNAGKAHAAATTKVTMEDFLFSPATVSVHVGDLVTWHNSGKEPHTATADNGSFDTGTVPAGGSASHMFTQPGTFTYVCTIHPNMHGTVKVLSAGGGSGGGGGGSGSSFSSSSNSEAAAVNSPNAGGDKNTLPASGMAAGALALVGIALLASGFGVRFSTRQAPADGRQLRLF
jgi:plastocyanin